MDDQVILKWAAGANALWEAQYRPVLMGASLVMGLTLAGLGLGQLVKLESPTSRDIGVFVMAELFAILQWGGGVFVLQASNRDQVCGDDREPAVRARMYVVLTILSVICMICWTSIMLATDLYQFAWFFSMAAFALAFWAGLDMIMSSKRHRKAFIIITIAQSICLFVANLLTCPSIL